MKKLFLISLLVQVLSSSLFAQQDSSFWNERMKMIALPTSNTDWINFIPGINLRAQTFFIAEKRTLGLGADDEMKIYKTETDELGFIHYRYQQFCKQYRVLNAEYLLHEKDGRLVSANGKMIRGLKKDTRISVPKEQALRKALNYFPSAKYAWELPALEENRKNIFHDNKATYYPTGELVWIPGKINGSVKDPSLYELAYLFDIYNAGLQGKRIFISAVNGSVLSTVPIVPNCVSTNVTSNFNGQVPFASVFVSNPAHYELWDDCQQAFVKTYQWNTNLANATIYTSTNNNWTSVSSAASSHWAVDRAYSYFLNVHGRNGWNGGGAGVSVYQDALFCNTPNCTPNNPNNASFSNGVLQVGNSGNTNVIDDWNTFDIISHEFTHGVTESSASLVYQKESGALNESFSDIFGASAYDRFSNGTNPNVWLVGFDRKNPSNTSQSLYIRNMSNPNDKSDPDTYLGTNWVSTTTPTDVDGDNWGVHTNSGVQNFMYYLLVSGGSGTNDLGNVYSVAGIGFADARRIAYRALTVYLTANSQYADARSAWLHAAEDLFGSCSNQAIQTGKAWYAAGLNPPFIDQVICGPFNGFFSGVASGIYKLSQGCIMIVNNGATAYFGGAKVIMYPGFKSGIGSNFRAYVSDCIYAAY